MEGIDQGNLQETMSEYEQDALIKKLALFLGKRTDIPLTERQSLMTTFTDELFKQQKSEEANLMLGRMVYDVVEKYGNNDTLPEKTEDVKESKEEVAKGPEIKQEVPKQNFVNMESALSDEEKREIRDRFESTIDGMALAKIIERDEEKRKQMLEEFDKMLSEAEGEDSARKQMGIIIAKIMQEARKF